jgi:hypothetical protein
MIASVQLFSAPIPKLLSALAHGSSP